jgi:hypothetical protein
MFAGNLAVSTAWYNRGNLDAATTTNATVKILHADGTIFGQTSVGATLTDTVSVADQGKLQVIITPVSTAYIDAAWTTQNNQQTQAVLSSVSPVVVSGVTVYKYTLDVSKAAPLGGGETSRAVTLKVGEYIADVSGLTYISVVNGTSADFSGTSYVSTTASGYISTGMTQTDAFKIVKVELSMPDAANITLFDNGNVKNLQVKIETGNGQPAIYAGSNWNHYTGGTYLTGNIGVSDMSQEYYGLPVVYGSNDAATSISYTVSAQCANFAASGSFVPTLVITYISPAGVTGSISRPVAFTDS